MMMYARGALSVQSHAHRVVIYASTGNRSREVVWGATNPNPEYMRERERERTQNAVAYSYNLSLLIYMPVGYT